MSLLAGAISGLTPARSGEAGGPFDGFAEVRQLGSDVGAEGGLEGDDVTQNAEGIFAHFRGGEELAGLLGEVQAELQGSGWDGDADVVVGQEKAAVPAGDGAAGIQEPGPGAGGIHVQELEEFLLQVPEAEETVLGDADGAEKHQRLEKGKVGVGVAGAVSTWEFEAVLEAGD